MVHIEAHRGLLTPEEAIRTGALLNPCAVSAKIRRVTYACFRGVDGARATLGGVEVEAELWGVMPTYRRRHHLIRTLAALGAQTRVLDHLVIIDNGRDIGSLLDDEIANPTAARHVVVLPQESNLGPAGALAVGLGYVLDHATPSAWVGSFDDDDPPTLPDTVNRLWNTAQELSVNDPRCGAVGFGGSRFDLRRVRVRRLHNDELTGKPVPVTMISGNHLPLVRVAAIRDVGTYNSELFFGHDDTEFFLRMNTRGWNVYCDTGVLQRYREVRGRTGAAVVPSKRLGPADWRRFYSIRNRVYIARTYAGSVPTARLMIELAAKVLANSLRNPRMAYSHARLTARAAYDGFTGRLGRSWDPELTPDGQLPQNLGKQQRLASQRSDLP